MLSLNTQSPEQQIAQFYQRNDVGLQIVEMLPSGLAVIDVNGTIRVWNSAIARMTMYPAAEVLGHSIFNIFPEQKKTARLYWEHLLKHMNINRSELDVKLPNGATLSLGFSMSLLSDEQDAPVGVVIVARGLNEQKRYDTLMAALDRSSRAAALSHTPQAIFSAMATAVRDLGMWTFVLMYDETRRVLTVMHVNIAHLLVKEASAPVSDDATLEAELEDFFVPIDDADAFRQVLTLGRAYYYNNFLPFKNSVFPPRIANVLDYIAKDLDLCDAIIAPLRKEGKIVGEVIVGGFIQAEDVVPIGAYANQLSSALINADLWVNLEQRVAQRTATLQADQEQQIAILNNMTDAVVFISSEGNIIYVNPAWERLHGQEASRVTGHYMPDLLVLNQDRDTTIEVTRAIRESLRTAIAEGRRWQGEVSNQRGDGKQYYAEITLVPVHDDSNQLRNFVGVERDITHERELLRAKDRFVSDMSHELRTPLTNIKFYLSLLERGKAERRDSYMETLKRESNRLQNLIEDLLALSRLDQDRIEFQLKPVPINDFLNKLIIDRETMVLDRGLTLTFEPTEELPSVSADPNHLEKVASNILTNALNYTAPGGSIHVTTMVEMIENGKEMVGFQVKDTGLGMTADDHQRAFERFFRGTSSRTMNSPGTGLGLSICHEIVTRLKGYITVDSEPGQGSAFTVWLEPWAVTAASEHELYFD